MDRLFRPQYLTVALLMAICLALMTLVLPRFPDRVCNLPLWILILSEYLFAIGVSVCAQFQSLRQSFSNIRLAPGLISLGIVFFIAAIGVTFSPINAWGADGSISIGLGQLTILNLAILFSIFTITTQEHPEFEETLTKLESSNANRTSIKRLTQIRIKAIHPKAPEEGEQIIGSNPAQVTDPGLQSLRQTGSVPDVSAYQGLVNRTTQSRIRRAVDISTVEKLLIPPGSSTSQNQKPVTKDSPPEIKRLPSVNAAKAQNKTDQAKKTPSNAMSKLQALSASGTGVAHSAQAGTDTSALKSVLDRLDNDDEKNRVFKQKVDSEVEEVFSAMVPAEAQREVSKSELEPMPSSVDQSQDSPTATGAFLFAQPIDKEMDSIFAQIAPEAKPEIGKTQALSKSKTEPIIESKADSGVFKTSVDSEVENIFSGMVSLEAQRVVSTESQMQPAAQNQEEPRLFKEKVDDQVDNIFSSIAPAEAQKEVKNRKSVESDKASVSDSETTGDRSIVVAGFDASVSDQKNAIPELKDFGRLSSRASAESESLTQAGTMKTIGKLLIDSDVVEKIIKKAESGRITINLPSAKVISEVRGQGIQSLLKAIDSFGGVEGSMLVGEDGLIISSTLTTVADRDGTGVLAHGMLGNSNIVMQRLDLGELEQMILISNTKEGRTVRQLTTVCTDVNVGVLAVFLDLKTLSGLDNLLERISAIANG